jgi:hypothetical protein
LKLRNSWSECTNSVRLDRATGDPSIERNKKRGVLQREDMIRKETYVCR